MFNQLNFFHFQLSPMYSAFLNFSEAIEKNDDLQTSSTFLLHAETFLTVHHLKQGGSRIFSRVGVHFFPSSPKALKRQKQESF